jgi:protein-L-isoaspartate(D-aspartate) O-methyltransferase
LNYYKFIFLTVLYLSSQIIATNIYAADDYSAARNALLEEIEKDIRLTRFSTGKAKLSGQVTNALKKVPRHKFVHHGDEKYAYENRPLRIGYGQTISQPYIVAIMTELLDLKSSDKVLEIGTGSGYQAAILSTIVKSVYSMEIIEPLAKQASLRLSELGYHNVKTRAADGYYGWQKAAPFNAIIVTAAASHIPPPLIQQLKPGGKMIIPVGGRFFTQQLMLIEKTSDDKVQSRQILPVSFVPFTGDH